MAKLPLLFTWMVIVKIKAVDLKNLCHSSSWSAVSSNIPLENSLKTANLLQCLYMCKYIPKCESVTYDVTQRLCAFNSQVNETRTAGYAFKKYQEMCNKQMDVSKPCESRPCQGTKQCLSLGSNYTCLSLLQCPKPNSPENGQVSFDGSSILSTRKFSCDEGYRLMGASESKCQTDGTWDESPPVCQIDCGIPAAVDGTTVQYTSTTLGSVAMYTCTGLALFEDRNKSKKVTCSAGAGWSMLQDRCVNDLIEIDGWILVFRVTADVNIHSYDVWINDSVYHDYPADRDDVMPGCRSLDGSLPCNMHFKSKLVKEWESWPIRQVKVVVLDKGVEMAEVVFSGEGTDKDNWFRQSKVTSSTWADLQTTDANIFSIKGWSTRRFYINYFLGSCRVDEGWFVVLDKEPVCSAYTFPTGPNIMYAPPPSKAYIASEYRHADVMAILVKLA